MTSAATSRAAFYPDVSAGGPAVCARWSFQSHPNCSCHRDSSTAVMETQALPSQGLSSSQPECVGSPAVLHPEHVAATPEKLLVSQPKTPVIFVMDLPAPSLDHCAPGHLGLRTSRHRHVCMAAKDQPKAAYRESC
ncbi:hypothetical protein MTO96_035394 [Rhipicephalus appendiculatus]